MEMIRSSGNSYKDMGPSVFATGDLGWLDTLHPYSSARMQPLVPQKLSTTEPHSALLSALDKVCAFGSLHVCINQLRISCR